MDESPSSSGLNRDVYLFKNGQNLNISCIYWTSSSEDFSPKAIILLIHGAGEHYGRYEGSIVKYLIKADYAVFSHDHAGHGRSEGDRSHIENFDYYVDDCERHIKLFYDNHQKFSKYPFFIIGHSMGGTIAILLSMRFQYNFMDKKSYGNYPNLTGTVLSAPAVAPNPETCTWSRVLIAKLLASLWPQFQIAKFKTEWCCRDVNIQNLSDADPLNYHGGMKAQFCMQLLYKMYFIQENLDKMTFPFLILHGTCDKICDIAGTHLFYEGAKSDDKLKTIYDGAYHQLLNEPDGVKEQVVDAIISWINARTVVR